MSDRVQATTNDPVARRLLDSANPARLAYLSGFMQEFRVHIERVLTVLSRTAQPPR